MSAQLDRYGNPLPAPPTVAEHAKDWEDAYDGAFPETASMDPEEVAQRYAELEKLRGIVRKENVRRALEPTNRPIFQQGELVGYEAKWDNSHLKFVSEKLLAAELVTKEDKVGETVRLVIKGDSGDDDEPKLELGS